MFIGYVVDLKNRFYAQDYHLLRKPQYQKLKYLP